MKIIHFADVHLGMENYGKIDSETGLNSRLGDFLNSFDVIVNTAIDKKVDLVIFAGDAYKTREPSPTYQRAFASKIYQIASANIPIAMLVGNHDFPNALGKANTLDIYKTLNVPNIHMIGNNVNIIETKSGPIQIAGLPWFTKQQLLLKDDYNLPLEKMHQKMSKMLSDKIMYLSSKIDSKIPSILLAHATVEGSTFGSERSVMIGSDIILPLKSLKNSRFSYIALGHLHKYQEILKVPPVIYSGSIERIDFGEEKEDKGFVLINIDQSETANFKTTWQFIKTPARRFLSVHSKISDIDEPTDKVINDIEKTNIKDAVVKLTIEISEEQQSELS
ncbi:MAG: Nuclease SbcCD subunit, partial [Candidatus Berkelbacteria bacterium]|nr:Nuclease SbcCD subunit [Candidatus Berkelbacteria bacterium]